MPITDDLSGLYQFNAYSQGKQADLLLQDGVYLRTRNRLQCDVYLFWMADGEFYGELWLHQGTTDLYNIRTFIYQNALAWYPDLCRMTDEELAKRKGIKFAGLDGLTFEK